MTTAFLVSPAAEQDVIAIGTHIEADDPRAARKLVTEIYGGFARMAERPALGHRRPDLTSLPVRFWTLRGRYMIVFRGDAAPIEIVRVLSTYRDVAALLGEGLS